MVEADPIKFGDCSFPSPTVKGYRIGSFEYKTKADADAAKDPSSE